MAGALPDALLSTFLKASIADAGVIDIVAVFGTNDFGHTVSIRVLVVALSADAKPIKKVRVVSARGLAWCFNDDETNLDTDACALVELIAWLTRASIVCPISVRVLGAVIFGPDFRELGLGLGSFVGLCRCGDIGVS